MEIDLKLLRKSNLKIDDKPTVKIKAPEQMTISSEDVTLLEQFGRYYDDLSDFRERRKRARRYYRGDSLSDEITDENDEVMTEEQYLKNQGIVPLKQNLIRSYMKSLIGQYSQNPSSSVVMSTKRKDAKYAEMLSNSIKYANQINQGEWLDLRAFEEYGISGAPIRKIGYKHHINLDRKDAFLENVNPRRFVYNTDVADIRLTDLRIVGEVLDVTIEDLVEHFAKGPKQEEYLKALYADPKSNMMYNLEGMKPDMDDNIDFYTSDEPEKCRIYEIWYLKSIWGMYYFDPMKGEECFDINLTEDDILTMNAERTRIALDEGIPEDDIALISEYYMEKRQIWHYKYLTPHAYCLAEGPTPYAHHEHPYAFVLYPLVDGEVWGFVEDIIDQQRYVNRLIMLMDKILMSGAKGVWMVPEDVVPDNYDKQDYLDELARVGGALYYKVNKSHQKIPEQITSKSMPVGLSELISLQMQFGKDVSGIQPSIQGMQSKSGTPASQYAQEAQNAATNMVDYMKMFQLFKKVSDTKLLKTIVQYYKEKRYLNIAGVDYRSEATEYDPEVVDIDFDVVIAQSLNTPVYRQLIDDQLIKLLEMQQINIETFLQNTSMPFADKILESIQQQKQQMQQGMAGGQMTPEQMQQMGANPEVVNAINQSLAGGINQ